jgi:hypothetical protein
MNKKFKLILSVTLISALLIGCGQQAAIAPEQMLLNQQPVETLAKKKTEKWKTVARMKKTKAPRPRKNSGGSYQNTLRFEYNGSIFTPASEDVSEFMQRFGSDIDDWQLDELENDSFDQLGKRRFQLTIFGPDRSRLDSILSEYREHLRSLG